MRTVGLIVKKEEVKKNSAKKPESKGDKKAKE